MDYSLAKENPQPDTTSHTNARKLTTPLSSPPKPLSFRNTPSPDHAQVKHKHQASSFYKAFGQHPISTEQYTPLAISPSRLLSARTPDDVDHLILEHRYEVETLLIEIGKLQEELHQAHQLRGLEGRKNREEFQEVSNLQISQIRVSQQGQAEVFELQIRRLREQLADKSHEVEKVTTLLQREKQTNEREKNSFHEKVQLLIEKKNAEIYQLKQEGDNKLRDFEFERSNQIEQIRYVCGKEISGLNKELEKHKDEFSRLKSISETENQEKQKIIVYLENERNLIENRSEKRMAEQEQKYENIRSKFNELISEFSEDSQSSRADLLKIFEEEYAHMMNLIKTMEKDNNQMRKQFETVVLSAKVERETFREENDSLKDRIKDVTDSSLIDMELLKVKLAVLHGTDLKNLKDLYEMKLKHSSDNIVRMDEQVSKLREYTNLLSAEKYELKKRYEMTISNLNSKIMKIRMGITVMESEHKQRMENQKSVMLMTSRSFLKEAQVKDSNNKFLEEEIRKLRQLMDLQGRENENAERAIEERVLVANNELERLSSKVVIIAKQKQDLERTLDELREFKDKEIQMLKNQLIPNHTEEAGGIVPELKIIEDLREDIRLKKEEMGILKDKICLLESQMKEMQAVTERLQMESNMNVEELKKEFRVVAEGQLVDFKSYYEEKLLRLEEEKVELKKITSSQYEQITELIKKYRQTEEDLKGAVKMMKKRTQLEQKVMNLGLDVNLVKNIADLLPINNS